MLTKQVINQNAKDIIKDSSDIDSLNTMSRVYLQATKAIEFVAEIKRLQERNLYLLANLKLADTERVEALEKENERLKAKLAEIKAECNKAMLVKNPLKHAGCLLLFGDKLNNILAIIDKDGE